MGIGTVSGGRINLVVVARHQMGPAEWAQWQRALIKSSELLWDATEGQVAFGDIYIADDATGEATADMILYDAGDPSFNTGPFGEAGEAMHLMPYVKSQVLTVLHELGHALWRLGEEYSQPLTNASIDDSNPAPDLRTIPTEPNGLGVDELVDDDARAILEIDGTIERHRVVANTSTSVTVDDDFSVLPTDADRPFVWFQRPAECADSATPNFCIMENSRDAAGELQPDGTWVPAANPVTEFCSDSNHDPDTDTQQEDRNGESCWSSIVTEPGFTTLTEPGGAATPGPGGAPPPTIFVLDPDPRYAIVLDRSFSMSEGTKLSDAQHGATFWVEACAEVGEKLTVIWYDHNRDTLLDLTDVASLTPTQQEDLIDDIDALTPGGATNIRDALLEALTQISSEPTRAATQVAVLLSDGQHNSPLFSSAQSAIPVLRENGMVVYALGVGDADEVDQPTLDELANETGGRSYAVGTAQPNEIETALVEIHNEVRGAIIDSLPVMLDVAKDLPIDDQLEPWLDRDRGKHKKRPQFDDLADALGADWSRGRLRFKRKDRAVSVPIFVEEGAARLWVTLLHPDAHDAWLYLVDPDGNPVPINLPGHQHRRSTAPHEFSIVTDPLPGWWSVVLIRPQPGPAIRCHIVAGLEHRDLRTRVHAPASAIHGALVPVSARAHFALPLTGLRVRGRLRSPNGNLVDFVLDDTTADGDASGVYRGGFPADEVGLYRGHIEIVGSGSARSGQALNRMLHLAPGDDTVVLNSAAPQFRRRIPIQVMVRKPGTTPRDDDREQEYIDRHDPCGWARPKKLRSAKRPRRRSR